jgi:sugar lactone lactonase YvrE
MDLAAETYTFITFAGSAGYSDGTGNAARFFDPTSVAADRSTNLYVAEFVNHVVRKISLSGTNWVVTTLAGLPGVPGTNDGIGSAARFNQPIGVSVDASNNVYVADFMNSTIRKISPAGAVTTLAGLGGVSGANDGVGAAARFYQPYGLAVDSSNNVYVADTYNQLIRVITAGGLVSTLAGQAGVTGTNNGAGSAALFNLPARVALDGVNNLYVAEYGNDAIRKITPSGVVSTFAGWPGVSGTNNGTGTSARFFEPVGVAMDAASNLYVADYGNNTIRKITSAAVVTTIAGLAGSGGSVDGTNSAARLQGPNDVCWSGSLFVADNLNCTIRRLGLFGTNWVASTVAGAVAGVGTNDGPGGVARFNVPNSLAIDASNNVCVADESNNTIRKISPAGVVSTLAGLAGVAGTNNGTAGAARFSHPEGVAVDRSNNVYVADQNNDTIRKVTPAGVVTTLAGLAGVIGVVDGTNSVARFYNPSDVAVDGGGNVYVTDYNNNTIRRLKPIGTNWAVTTIAGKAGFPGTADGTNGAASFLYPYDLTVDAATNLFVADTGNHTIRKIQPVGTNWVVSTLAGQAGIPGFADGTNHDALFNYPNGVALDASGRVYVADAANNTLRLMTAVGTNWVVTTIGGLAGVGGNLDGTGSAARFNSLYGVAVDSSNNLFIADSGNNTIRKGLPAASLPPLLLSHPGLVAGRFSFGLTGLAGLRAEVQDSQGVTNFQLVGSYVLTAGTNYFSGTVQNQGNRFYRAHVP